MAQRKILIVELGSQVTLKIPRVLRDLGHRSIVLPPQQAEDWLAENDPKAIILSGGQHSVYDKDAPAPPVEVLTKGVPVLGICYGMQWLAHKLQGKVEAHTPEYAQTQIEVVDSSSPLFEGTSPEQDVWMSHGDAVTKLPPGFKRLALSSNNNTTAAMTQGRIFGVQFHPEVSHTSWGTKILKNFVELIAKREPDYTPDDLESVVAERIAREVGSDRAILLFSGGVDSTTIAKPAQKVLGERLLCVTFDGGHLREGEVAHIAKNATLAGVQKHSIIHAEGAFVESIGATLDPEKKREKFRLTYARLACEAAHNFGAKVIIQGTIAPDRIESGMTGGARIKTHHNSAGLNFGTLREVHPIDDLFKDEVRTLSQRLGLPQEIFNRRPFPGPGNFLRVVNIPVDVDSLAAVQWAQARTEELLLADPRYADVSQDIVAVLGKAVGVKGDKREFGYIIGVRAVRTKDFMTAEGVAFAEDFQKLVSRKLCEHPRIVQVGFFPTDKPPGTTEFE